MNNYQKCPHCGIVSKPYTDGEYRTRNQCPECGRQFARENYDRRLTMAVCRWCSTEIRMDLLDRIRGGEDVKCPVCEGKLPPVKIVKYSDPQQRVLPGLMSDG